MAVYHASLAVAILLGAGGQSALKSAAAGSATLVVQFGNHLTL